MISDKKYFLSLGAGPQQVPLIESAIEAGFSVIAVDKNTGAEGNKLATLSIEESLTNYRRIHYKLMNSLYMDQIAGGACVGYGAALLSWSFLSERLGLIAPSITQMEFLQDKLLVRNKLKDLHHPAFKQPLYLDLENFPEQSKIESFTFPAILKSRTIHGKRYIQEFHTAEQFLTFINTNWESSGGPDYSSFILEEKIIGHEIIQTGFAQSFQYKHVMVSDKTASSSAPFIDLEHKYPSVFNKKENEIREILQEIITLLQIDSSPLVSEWLVKDDSIFLVELSPQVPGEFLPQFLIPAAKNYDYYDNLVRLAIGEPVEIPAKRSFGNKSARLSFIPKKTSEFQWQQMSKKAAFTKILNENPADPPRNNSDRYAVMGFINK